MTPRTDSHDVNRGALGTAHTNDIVDFDTEFSECLDPLGRVRAVDLLATLDRASVTFSTGAGAGDELEGEEDGANWHKND
jgi:hypothetical protein